MGRYDSLRLYSPATYDALPGLRFPHGRSAFPTGRQMAEYLETYADHHPLPIEIGVRVDLLQASNGADGYTISARDRHYEANQVIVATAYTWLTTSLSSYVLPSLSLNQAAFAPPKSASPSTVLSPPKS